MSGQLQRQEKRAADPIASNPVTANGPTPSVGVSNQVLQRSLAAGNTGAPDGSDPLTPAGRECIVDDTVAALEPGQMKKSEFLAELNAAVCKTAADALAGTPWSEKGCPYIEQWFTYYQSQDANHVERAAQKYAPAAASVATAHDYIPPILARVRGSMRTWVATGLVAGVPAGIPIGLPGNGPSRTVPGAPAPVANPPAAANAGPVMAKTRDGLPPRDSDPRAIRAKLGAGAPLESRVRMRMGAVFDQNFADARVHLDAAAGRLSSELNARAFTVGEHIAFAPGEYRPGTPVGDALIAHELAHVAQQRGSGTAGLQPQSNVFESSLEQVANLAAASAVQSMHGGMHVAGLIPAPRLLAGRGLRLSRCGADAKVPTDLTTVQAKAEWIRNTLKGSASMFEPRPGAFLGRTKGEAIVDMLATLPAAQFIDIQSQIDMSAVLDSLDDFQAVRLGTLGPLQGDTRVRLNQKRADYLYRMTKDRGAAEAQVVTHWMFNNMYGDDIKDVLTLLGADQHLYNTVDTMPAVLDLLRARGIDRTKFQDRGWKAKDIATGLGHFLDSVVTSGQAAKGMKADTYLLNDLELPDQYQKAMTDVMNAELQQALTPGKMVLGALDYIAFNIPSSVVGLATGTVSGIKDLTEGHVEAATEKLTGTVIFVVGLALGVRAFRKSARMATLLEMTPEGQAALIRLRASIGQAGIDRVAKYAQADSQAAFLVREQGLAGIEALDKAAGDVAAARKLIGTDVTRLGPLLSADTLAGLELATQQALATLPDATLRALAGTDAATMEALAQMLRETSPAMRARLIAMAEQNPAGFGELLRTQKTAALDTLRTGPFSTVDELASAVNKSAGRVRVPIVKGGVTLYESIDPNNPPQGWQFKDTVTKSGGSVTIRTDVTGPNGATGYFVRRLNPATGQLDMLEAFLRKSESGPQIPGSIPGGVELRQGKGTPTVTYATLRQLRLEGVAMGGLRRVVMRSIENFQSICRLEWMRRNFPGRSINQLVLDTDSVSYASTTIEQSGSRIVGGRVVGGTTQPIGTLMAKYEAEAAEGGKAAAQNVRAEHDQILHQYGFTRRDTMLTGFNIELDLEPNAAQSGGSASK